MVYNMDNLMTEAEITDKMGMARMITMIAMVLWMIGFLLVLLALVFEFLVAPTFITSTFDTADTASSKLLLTLKLGGIGFILAGIFIVLVVIARALRLMPHRLYYASK